MQTTDTEAPPFHDQAFKGELKQGNLTAEVTFFVALEPDGELSFRFEPITRTDAAFAMEQDWSRQRRETQRFELTGQTENGISFASYNLVITTFGFGFDKLQPGFYYVPRAKYSTAEIRIPLNAPVERAIHRMLLKGAEGFYESTGSTAFGDVVMTGADKPDDHDRVLGEITVLAPGDISDGEAWRHDTKRLMLHVRSVMSFASSVTLRSPVSEFQCGQLSILSFRSQIAQQRPSMRNIRHLDLQPIFDAALRSFESPPIKVIDLPLAIEWLAFENSYKEVRLMSTMTALENLIDANLDRKEKQVMRRKPFGRLKSEAKDALAPLITAFAAREKLDPDACDELVSSLDERLAEFNRRSLRNKIRLLAARWGVPLVDIGDARIDAGVRARNFIVHTGRLPEPGEAQPDLWEHFTVMREVMVRFVLTALGFKGRYVTWLDGVRDADFPPPSSVEG